MKLNELQLPRYSPQQIDSVKQQLKTLVANASTLSDANPAKILINKLLSTISMAGSLAEAIAKGTALNTTFQIIDQLFTNPIVQAELAKINDSDIKSLIRSFYKYKDFRKTEESYNKVLSNIFYENYIYSINSKSNEIYQEDLINFFELRKYLDSQIRTQEQNIQSI